MSLSRIPTLVRIPPPAMFAFAFLAGVAIQQYVPVRIESSGTTNAFHKIGLVLIVAGFAIALAAAALFAINRTSIIPHGTASKLLQGGPFRFTRNPMYLSLVVVYLGAAAAFAQAWPLLLLPLPIVVVDRIVIPFEESRLHDVFGNAYDEYRVRVRRWL